MNEYQEQMVYNEGYRQGKEDALKEVKTKKITYYDEDEQVWKVGELIVDEIPSIDMIPKDYHDRVCEEMAKRHQAELANMVEVVRCKECKWASHWQTLGICSVTSQRVKPDDFCSYGRRKEGLTHGYMWTCPICGLEVHSDFTKCLCCGYERQKERSGE